MRHLGRFHIGAARYIETFTCMLNFRVVSILSVLFVFFCCSYTIESPLGRFLSFNFSLICNLVADVFLVADDLT